METQPDTNLWHGTRGPHNASIMFVGESWDRDEDAAKLPFVGQSGRLLETMSNEAGINLGDVFMTNVVSARPPNNELSEWFYTTKEAKERGLTDFRGCYPHPRVMDGIRRLWHQVREVKPKIIVAFGNYAMWALSSAGNIGNVEGKKLPVGITSWRGSMWYTNLYGGAEPEFRLVPVLHPASVMREWYWRAPTVHDLRVRVARRLDAPWRDPRIVTRWAPPAFKQAVHKLQEWTDRANRGDKFRLVCDIETTRKSFITTIGLCDGPLFAMTIPFVNVDPKIGFTHYWNHEEEYYLRGMIREILRHPNVLVEGQNFIYDMQYLQRECAVTPNLRFDTMLGHHLLFPGTPKGLDYLSSMYCEYHWYWKDDGKDWDLKGDLKQHLDYNIEDLFRQYECGTVLQNLIKRAEMEHLWAERLEVNQLALSMMNRGVRQDTKRRKQLAFELAMQQPSDSLGKLLTRGPGTGDLDHQAQIGQRDSPIADSGDHADFALLDLL